MVSLLVEEMENEVVEQAKKNPYLRIPFVIIAFIVVCLWVFVSLETAIKIVSLPLLLMCVVLVCISDSTSPVQDFRKSF